MFTYKLCFIDSKSSINTSVNVYKNCPQFTPGIIGQHFDLQLSVDNNCSATRLFSLLNYYIRPLISLAQRIA
jgi:hypothetical protein